MNKEQKTSDQTKNKVCKKCKRRLQFKKYIYTTRAGYNMYYYAYYCMKCQINYFQTKTEEIKKLGEATECTIPGRTQMVKGENVVDLFGKYYKGDY